MYVLPALTVYFASNIYINETKKKKQELSKIPQRCWKHVFSVIFWVHSDCRIRLMAILGWQNSDFYGWMWPITVTFHYGNSIRWNKLTEYTDFNALAKNKWRKKSVQPRDIRSVFSKKQRNKTHIILISFNDIGVCIKSQIDCEFRMNFIKQIEHPWWASTISYQQGNSNYNQ